MKLAIRIFFISWLIFHLVSFAQGEKYIYLDNTSDIAPAAKQEKAINLPEQNPLSDNFVRSFYNKSIDAGVEINSFFTEDKLVSVDLEDCLALAMEHNLNIKTMQARKEASRWEYKNQRAQYLPNSYYMYTFSNLHGFFLAGEVIPDYVNETPFQSLFWLDWTLLDGGFRLNKAKAAKNMYYSSSKDLDFTKERVLRDTAVSYYKLLGYKLKIEVMARNLHELESQLEINHKMGVEFNITRANAAVENAKQKLELAYRDYRTEQANLANLLGVDVSSAIYPKEDELSKITLISDLLTIDDLSKSAISSRVDIESMKLKIKALQNERNTCYSQFLPTLLARGMLGNVGTSRLGMQSLSRRVGLVATYPFGKNLGVATHTEFKKFDALIEEANAELENRMRNIQESIITSYYGAKTSQERIDSAQVQVKYADESLLTAILRLQKGGSYNDVLQTQGFKTEARLNFVNSIIDYDISQINLLFDSGAMSVYNLTQNKQVIPIEEPKVIYDPK